MKPGDAVDHAFRHRPDRSHNGGNTQGLCLAHREAECFEPVARMQNDPGHSMLAVEFLAAKGRMDSYRTLNLRRLAFGQECALPDVPGILAGLDGVHSIDIEYRVRNSR